jgi:hypothetical protein
VIPLNRTAPLVVPKCEPLIVTVAPMAPEAGEVPEILGCREPNSVARHSVDSDYHIAVRRSRRIRNGDRVGSP